MVCLSASPAKTDESIIWDVDSGGPKETYASDRKPDPLIKRSNFEGENELAQDIASSRYIQTNSAEAELVRYRCQVYWIWVTLVPPGEYEYVCDGNAAVK